MLPDATSYDKGISPLKAISHRFNATKDKANILNRQYQSIFKHKDADHVPCPTGMPYRDMDDIHVEEESVMRLWQLGQTLPLPMSWRTALLNWLHYLQQVPTRRHSYRWLTTCVMQISQPYSKMVLVMILWTKGQFHLNPWPLCCKLLEHAIVSNTARHLEKICMTVSMVLELREVVRPIYSPFTMNKIHRLTRRSKLTW